MCTFITSTISGSSSGARAFRSEGGCAGRRPTDRDNGGHSARFSGIPTACECVPSLRLRSLGRAVAHAPSDRKAGVLEDGRLIETTEGTPQGSVASPLLANVYLHYVYDLWVEQWRTRLQIGRRVCWKTAD